MNALLRCLLLAALPFLGSTAAAQQVWLQIEARAGEAAAVDAAADYARRIQNIAGFRLGQSRWYAIVAGPFDPDAARAARQSLRARGLIPADAFTSEGQNFGRQIWPIGQSAAAPDAPAAPRVAELPEPVAADETPAEARRSEAQLGPDARRELQIALRWAGHYAAAIDGAFGRGTRGAMRAWQKENGYPVTGILTTIQRAALLQDYNAVLDGLDMGPVRDGTAGIVVAMPRALVSRGDIAPPFVHYDGSEGSPHRVLLISQRGGQAELRGLYDIMQTLEIVPPRGERQRGDAEFVLTGRNAEIVSHTEARLSAGAIKGFTLIWPADDEDRRRRVLQEMQDSFTSLPGIVMDDLAGTPTEDQSIDLLAGLEIRRPERRRSGFYVGPAGEVLTSAAAVEGCSRMTLGGRTEMDVAATDAAAGLALLVPRGRLAPRAIARFQTGVPRLQSRITLAGYSFEGRLGAPSLVSGALAELRGLGGAEGVRRFDLAAEPGDIGGPILDASGAVLGMLVPPDAGGRDLPGGTAFAANVTTLATFLSQNGIDASAAEDRGMLARADLERRARDITVLVDCWTTPAGG